MLKNIIEKIMKLENNTGIVILTHTQYKDNIPIYGPADSIKDYLKSHFKGDIFYLQHSLYPKDGSILTRDLNGVSKAIFRYDFHRNWSNLARYAVDFIYSLKLLLPQKGILLIIATDPLNFLYGYFLKKINRIKKIIFFTVDYGYKRFDNRFLNWAYHRLDRFAVKKADLLWNSSIRISQLRVSQGVALQRNIYIPNSPLSEGIRVKPLEEIEPYTLVMVFSNYRQVDFKIIFDSLKALSREFPRIKVKLIGRGNFQEAVREMLKENELLNYVEFLDTHTHRQTLEQVSCSAIGLECNTQQLYWNEFREPIKIREYVYFGLPVISKPGHSLAQEIIEERVGFVVNNSEEFIRAAKILLGDRNFYCQTRERALRLAGKYNKERILSDIFTRMGFRVRPADGS